MNTDEKYADMISQVLYFGDQVQARNSAVYRVGGARRVFQSTPLVSVRKTAWKNALREMEWFLSGSSHIDSLHPSVQPWWQPWVDDGGFLANGYGHQFRAYRGQDEDTYVDQVQELINGIIKQPFSRRHVITTWNTADMLAPETTIALCHGTVIQCMVNSNGGLEMITYQRSADLICGLPHNWIQYWAFLMWLAHRTGTKVSHMAWMGGDIHLYVPHLDLANKIIGAVDSVVDGEVPELVYTPTGEEFRADDFTLSGDYKPLITEKAEMIV
jgi:thymidylate synthase